MKESIRFVKSPKSKPAERLLIRQGQSWSLILEVPNKDFTIDRSALHCYVLLIPLEREIGKSELLKMWDRHAHLNLLVAETSDEDSH